MSIINILVALFIVGFVLWVIKQIPIIDIWVKNIMYGVVVFFLILWLLKAFGLWSGLNLHL